MGCWIQVSFAEILSKTVSICILLTFEGTMMFHIPHVKITLLKGYCVLSTFTEDIHNQSCSSDRGTPCSFSSVTSAILESISDIQPDLSPLNKPSLARFARSARITYHSNFFISIDYYWNITGMVYNNNNISLKFL